MIYTRKRNNRQRILIGKIYADWCFHCKQMKPAWETLKRKMQKLTNKPFEFVEIESQDKMKLAKFEKTHGKVQVDGYPTLFSKKIGGPIVLYGGNRDLASLERWVMSHRYTKGGKKTRKRHVCLKN